MNLDDYKELMKFHIMFCDIDLSDFNYAAVDRDGKLHAYLYKPVDLSEKEKDYQWTLRATQSRYTFISKLPELIDWTKTLIEI